MREPVPAASNTHPNLSSLYGVCMFFARFTAAGLVSRYDIKAQRALPTKPYNSAKALLDFHSMQQLTPLASNFANCFARSTEVCQANLHRQISGRSANFQALECRRRSRDGKTTEKGITAQCSKRKWLLKCVQTGGDSFLKPRLNAVFRLIAQNISLLAIYHCERCVGDPSCNSVANLTSFGPGSRNACTRPGRPGSPCPWGRYAACR